MCHGTSDRRGQTTSSMFYGKQCTKRCFVGEHHCGTVPTDIFGSPSHAFFHVGFREHEFQLYNTILDLRFSWSASYDVNVQLRCLPSSKSHAPSIYDHQSLNVELFFIISGVDASEGHNTYQGFLWLLQPFCLSNNNANENSKFVFLYFFKNHWDDDATITLKHKLLDRL